MEREPRRAAGGQPRPTRTAPASPPPHRPGHGAAVAVVAAGDAAARAPLPRSPTSRQKAPSPLTSRPKTRGTPSVKQRRGPPALGAGAAGVVGVAGRRSRARTRRRRRSRGMAPPRTSPPRDAAHGPRRRGPRPSRRERGEPRRTRGRRRGGAAPAPPRPGGARGGGTAPPRCRDHMPIVPRVTDKLMVITEHG